MTAHPLAELADALFADPTPQQRARIARILLSLHPDVARVALALADGLKVPDGWSVHMDGDGDIKVSTPDGGVRYVRRVADRIWWLMGPGSVHDGGRSTAQAAVDAAVEALGGPR